MYLAWIYIAVSALELSCSTSQEVKRFTQSGSRFLEPNHADRVFFILYVSLLSYHSTHCPDFPRSPNLLLMRGHKPMEVVGVKRAGTS